MFALNDEAWRVVSEARNYEVNTKGEVRNRNTGRVLKAFGNNRTGHPQVTLMDAGYRVTRQVHTLVSDAFGG